MKHILLSITGLTPQIVTEAVYELKVKKKITIDEIYIITTAEGKKVLLGKSKIKNTPKNSLKTELEKMCKEINIKTPIFNNSKKHIITAKEESIELADIRSDKENKLFPNKTAEFLKEKTSEKETTLHCVLSGGRKSMSAHLALLLSLFGRNQDKLYHILTDEKYEFGNFYPKNKAEAKAVIIAEIPFVRLRALKTDNFNKIGSYTDLVEKTQMQLSLLTDNKKLILNLADRTINYGDNKISMQPFELSLYLKFAEGKISKHKGFRINEITSVEFAEGLKSILEEKYNYHFDLKNKTHWSKKGLDSQYFRSKRAKINKKIKTLFSDEEKTQAFIISSDRVWGNTLYSIKATKNKLGINYE